MIGGVQPKVLMNVDENGNLVVTDDFLETLYKEQEKNWKLVRERDSLTKYSRAIIWINWNEDDTFKSQQENIEVGFSLLMSPFDQSFTWQTTVVTEIIENRERYIKFKTGNSIYELFKVEDEQ